MPLRGDTRANLGFREALVPHWRIRAVQNAADRRAVFCRERNLQREILYDHTAQRLPAKNTGNNGPPRNTL
jgi:hypothetical protein